MFAVVKIKEDERRLSKRIKYVFKRPVPQLERINVTESSYYYRLEIYKREISDNPDILCDLLGPCADRIILCDDCKLPNGTIGEIIRIQGYFQTVLLNTALGLLKSRHREFERLRLLLVDRRGEYTEFLPRLSDFASDVTVVTDKPSAYESVCTHLLESRGLSVVVTSQAGNLSRYDFTVSPQFDLNKLFNNTVIIRNKSTGLCDVLKGREIEIPDPVKQIIPHGVNRQDFVYALYRYCSIEELSQLCFSDMRTICSVG